MFSSRLVVIGASAGGFQPLLDLVASLPKDFPAAICIVLHIPAHSPSHLPEILSLAGPLPVSHPQDGERIQPGHIYCAPPDHHLLVEAGHFAVKRGPKENRSRPAIDVLFRSAGYSEGPAVIGVLLSGMLDDGTSGLWTIQRFGGITIVQDPEEAKYSSMPFSALNQVDVDHLVRSADLADLLIRLVNAPLPSPSASSVTDLDRHRIKVEIDIAKRDNALRLGVMELGKVTPQTCPECGGVLVQIKEGGFTRYRCHTGHAYTGDTLLTEVSEHVEEMLWRTMRTLEEATMLLDNTGAEFAENGNAWLAQTYARRARALEAQSRSIFEVIAHSETLSKARLEQDAREEE